MVKSMKSMKRVSKGKTCLGVFRSPLKCTLARDKSGSPIVLCRNCKDCGEQRCKAHCACARRGSDKAKGRSASRGYAGEVGGSRARVRVVADAPPAPVVAPVGRAAPLSCVLLSTAEWYKQCCKDLETAAEVELASYVYDNPAVQKKLLQRLRSRTAFSLNVYIDRELFGKGGPFFEGARIRELVDAGAKVYLCRGKQGRGSYHTKAMIIDRRYMYTGSANFTYKSMDNEELTFKITGPPVKEVLEKFAGNRLAGRLWTGA